MITYSRAVWPLLAFIFITLYYHKKSKSTTLLEIPVNFAIETDRQFLIYYCTYFFGRLAQLVRASRLHREGREFESLTAHQFSPQRFFLRSEKFTGHHEPVDRFKPPYRFGQF